MTENEIGTRVIEAARPTPVPITYKGIQFDEGFRADLIVEDSVILELKSVERVAPAHKKQVQTYLKLTGCKLLYLLNFGEEVMRTGITRCVNGLEEQPLRHCASAGEEKVPTTGCYVAGIPSP